MRVIIALTVETQRPENHRRARALAHHAEAVGLAVLAHELGISPELLELYIAETEPVAERDFARFVALVERRERRGP